MTLGRRLGGSVPEVPAQPRIEQRRSVRRSINLILLEGAPSGAIQRIYDSFFIPFGLVLKASSAQIGLLAAMPSLLAALSQLATPSVVERLRSRRRVLLASCAIGTLLWLPTAFLPWLFGHTAVWWFLALATVSLVVYQFPAPAWGSWLPQLVPAKKLGKFVARRGSLNLVAAVAAALLIGRWLDLMHNHIYQAFMAVFLLALVLRVVCFLLFYWAYEPPLPGKPSPGTSALDFIKGLPSTNLGRFIGFTAALNFAASVAGPFFIVFMLRDLGFSYTKVVMLQVVSMVGFVIGYSLWGRLADRRGNVRVLRFATPLVGLFPLLYLVSRHYPVLMLAEFIGALGWSGFQLSSANFIYESSRPEDRSRSVAYFNASNGVGLFVGALLGGFVAPHLPALFSYSLLTLIGISGVLRLSTVAMLVLLVREVRRAPGAAVGR